MTPSPQSSEGQQAMYFALCSTNLDEMIKTFEFITIILVIIIIFNFQHFTLI